VGWKETAKLNVRRAPFVVAQLDEMEAQLEPGDWVQQAGGAMKIDYGRQTWRGVIVYLVTTRAIYARKRGAFGWKDLPPIAASDVSRYGVSRSGMYVEYVGETPVGRLAISVDTADHAQALADAVKAAYMHQTMGVPLHAPGSPEEVASDATKTRRLAEATSDMQFSNLVARFKASCAHGDYATVWASRCAFGYAVDRDRFESRDDWFWFNAYPALAGLELGKPKGPPLDTFCGLAEDARGADPEQRRAAQEIHRRYFGN